MIALNNCEFWAPLNKIVAERLLVLSKTTTDPIRSPAQRIALASVSGDPKESRNPITLYLMAGVLVLAMLLPRNAIADQSGDWSAFQSDFQVCSAPFTPNEERRLEDETLRDQKGIDNLQHSLALSAGVDSKSKQIEKAKLQKVQMDLLQTLERLECKHLTQLKDSVLRGPAESKPNFVEISVNYATDRVGYSDQSDPTKRFSGTLDSTFKDFSFGTARITIPTRRKPGEPNLPGFWNFVQRPDPNRFFVIQELNSLSREAFMKQINDPATHQESSLLLFVHGFDVTFADAALRTAQLAHDLQFPGRAMFYSWPSAGKVVDYWHDEDSSRISAPRFQKLLADLLSTHVTHIYIVTHSMGSRIIIPAVNALAAQGLDISKVSELILAAPDFNEIEFKDIAAAFQGLRSKGTHVTIYASSNDFALRASQVVHSYRRLGQSEPKVDIFPGLDSIDASMIAPMRRAFGHSYVCDSAEVIGDMEDIVLHGLAPKERGLSPLPGTQFGWTFSH